MSSPGLFAAFLITTGLYALLPGPAMLYAASRAVAGGTRAGLLATLGIHLGSYVHVVLAATGLALLFQAVPTLYAIVKLAGAVYLIGLGIGLMRVKSAREPPVVTTSAPSSTRRAFLQSIAVEVLNPKTVLFFVAFLPPFVDPAAATPVWLQIAVLGTIVNLVFSLVEVVCALLAGVVIARLRRSSPLRRWLQRAGGSLLIGLGLHVALQRS